MLRQLRGTAILLLFLGLVFSIPIVTVGFTVHGDDLALLAFPAVMLLVFLGPLSFLFASSIATSLELVVVATVGSLVFLAWLRAMARGPGHYIPYLIVTSWALLGGYFCVSLFFEHAV